MTKSETEASTGSGESSSNNSSQDVVAPKQSRYSKVYGFFGFKHAYNFPLWIIFAGAMLGFSLSRLQDFNYDKLFAINIAPGYMYYFGQGSYRIGMILHLAGALPAGIMMVLQFTPIVRHKFITFHRINGYIILLLLLVSNGSACVVLRHNHSGNRIAAQTAEAYLVIVTTIGMVMAWYNIRRLQIDQHRAWMLRTMFYMGTIISSRVLSEIASYILTDMGGYYAVWSCDELNHVYKEYGFNGFPQNKYPQCVGADPSKMVAVEAARIDTDPEAAGASTTVPFGASLWMAVVLHTIGVEIYLAMTPRESNRLRRVSYEKQVEAGFANPGSAGLTVDRWGDSEEYKPN